MDANITVQPLVSWPGERPEGERKGQHRPGGALSYFLRFPDVQGKFDVARAKAIGTLAKMCCVCGLRGQDGGRAHAWGAISAL